MGWNDGVDFSTLVGATISEIKNEEDRELRFMTDRGTFLMTHSQDCCENVELAEVVGDLDDLIGTPVLLAECVEHSGETPEGVTPPEYPDSYTWTFYKLATVKGHVTLRWLGESNGYYSESVDFELVPS